MNNKLMIEITANTKKAVEEIEQLKNEIKKFSTDLNTSNNTLKEHDKRLLSLANSVKNVVAAYAGFSAIKGAISIVGDFEQAIAKLKAISNATATEMDALKAKAEELGKSTMFSASEVAEGMNYLAMAGYKTKDIMVSIGDVLNLAVVGQVELAQASDIASNILSGFSLKAEETGRVVDVMTAAITNANTNIPELGEAMKYAAPQAKALGVSLEDTATAIGVLSNAGIKGTMAGTGLAMVLTRLAAPTGKAKDAIEKLGIKIYDANGKFLGLQNVLMQFNEKMKNLTQEAKYSYISEIFGQEAAKSAITLIDNVKASYVDLSNVIKNATGLTEQKVNIMMETFNGNLKELQSALEGLIIVVGNELLPALTKFVEFLTNATSNVTDFYKENKELINILTKLTVTFFALKKVFTIYKALFGAAAVARITQTAKAFKTLKGTVTLLTTAISKLGKANVILLALTAAIEGINLAFDAWEEKIKASEKYTKLLTSTAEDFSKTLDTLNEKMVIEDGVASFRLTHKELKKLKKDTKDLIELNNKKIEQLKKDSELTDAQKRALSGLVEQNKTLQEIYAKLEKTKPYKEANRDVDKVHRKVIELNKEQKEYLKELDKRLAKESEITKSIIQLRDEEIAKANELFNGTKHLTEATDKIIAFYARKELAEYERTYSKRIERHTRTVERLKQKEQELSEAIQLIQRDLQNKLKEIEQNRINAIEDINAKIHNLELSNANEYEKFTNKRKQIEDKLAKAKKALREGDLKQAKRYMSQYESLVLSLANKEIKENGKIIVSKQRANQIAIDGLNKLKTLTNDYYAKEKQQVQALHTQKLQQLKAQLQATKAQLQLEMQRLQLEKQLIEAVTNKKVDIDVGTALRTIKDLDAQIAQLDRKIKNPKKINVKADTNNAKKEIKDVSKDRSTKIKIDADTTQAETKIVKILNEAGEARYFEISANVENAYAVIDEIDEKIAHKRGFEVYADIDEALDKIFSLNNEVTKKRDVEITADIADAEKKINKIESDTRSLKPNITIKADTNNAINKIQAVDNKVKSLNPNIKVRADASAAIRALNSIPKVIYTDHIIREIHQRASGGLIPKFSRGGFARITGRIPGYDPYDSDDVPALLTRGEFVVKREAVNYYGDDFLYKLNNKLIPKFATGGLVEIKEPEKLIEKLSSNNNTKYNSSLNEPYDTHLLDELKEKLDTLKDLLDTLGDIKTPIAKRIKSLQEKGEKLLTNYKQDIENFNDNKQDKNKEKILKNDEKKIKDLFVDISDITREVQKYLKDVEKEKTKIRNRLRRLNIDETMVLPDDFDYVVDLKRLKRFYNSLLSLKAMDKDYINNKYNQFIRSDIEKNKAYVYSIGTVKRKEFLAKLGIRDISIASLLPANYYRYFNGTFRLEDDVINKIIAKYYKEHLPRFKTGGIVALQAGGKIPGYGGGDKNLALLENGEFVIRKEAVKAFGTDLFEKLNSLTLPKFKTGGMVGSMPTTNVGKSNETVNVNFQMPNGKSFEMQAEKIVADGLKRYLKRLS